MTDTGLIAARIAVYVAMMLAAGVPLYLLTARQPAALAGNASRMAGLAALAGLTASTWWALASVAAMAAVPVAQLDLALVSSVLEATPLGTVLTIRLLALIVAAFALWNNRARTGAVAASLALATCAWTGHAGGSAAGLGAAHRAGDVLHLLAAATWLGALTLFLTAALRGDDRQSLVEHLSRFAATGSVIVLVLSLTGLANALIIGGWSPDWNNVWFAVLAAKLALFAALLGLAATNRWRLTPALSRDPANSLLPLRLSLLAETAAALAVIALVGWLGTLSPA